MTGRSSRATFVLLLVTVVAVLCAALRPLPTPLRALGALPLLLFLPGCWIVEAVVPDLVRGVAERLALSVGLSLAVCVLSGLLLNLTPGGLSADAWVLTLGGITLLASAAALVRRNRPAPAAWPGQPLSPGRRGGALFALAGVILIGAFGLAHLGAEQQNAPDFTQLWITPEAGGGGQAAQLGVRNLEG
ncbi:MAG TPA: DUF1616 domain-containing protein, partial [Dehalococcoidia bacterium]